MSNDVLNEEFSEEQQYLDTTIDVIKKQIAAKEKVCQAGYDRATELGKYHWENLSAMDFIEKASSYETIERHATFTNDELKQLRQLKKALSNPYFGSIVLDIEGEQETYHIGITSIMEDLDFYVTDWRSPIASTFYNSRLGETKFKAPDGFISCNLKQRKQIKTEDGKVKRIIDSNIHLSDDELQEVLSKSSSSKMKNIVTTIQEEQNDVIRNLKDKKIIVQGCAGSGKTSVALHRLAYLLYNDQKSTSENMLVLSPSDVFSDYISNVLPELGENNVLQTTFSDFANAFVKGFDKIESYTEFVARYYDGLNSNEENKLNKFKFSSEYQKALDKFIKRKADAYRFRDDFSFNNQTIPVDYLNKIVEGLDNMPLYDKINELTDEVMKLYPKKTDMKKSTLRRKIALEFVKPEFNPKSLYNEFLQSDEFIEAYGKAGNKITKKVIEYPDLIGLLYLNFEMLGYPSNDLIHHLVVDEVQDYSPIQMEMISKMFSGATITALGDANQTINPYFKYDSLEEMKKTIGSTSNYMELNKAYRSSKEIMDYASDLIGDDKIEPVRESNNEPVKKIEVSRDNLFKQLVSDILDLRDKGFQRICIITKSSNEAKAIYEGLKGFIDEIEVLTPDSQNEPDFLVSPSYMAKGLEFDAVINYNSIDNPYEEEDKYLYYVACTRAQHDLVLYNEPKKLEKVMKDGRKKEI